MNLSREQAIAEHRKMWDWIVHETDKLKRKVEKSEYFDAIRIDYIPYNGCYCCEFNDQNPFHCGCDCIINWGKGLGCMESYFLKWGSTNNWQKAERLARIIAELPEMRADE